ncbi:MAG: zinc ribbon domain-containing protein [Betaproteobacteria bacterium]|nr:zinc ribbon domain-containing protein [Betaproteobacteria bacterium]
MPIFEYACSSCGNEFETLVRGSVPAPECPKCHGTALRKKLSTFAAISDAAAIHSDLPAPCSSCGHPGGPGACQFE